MYKNSYFQVNVKDDGTYLTVYPSLNGSEKLEYPEISLYLLKNIKLGSYDIEALKQALKDLNSSHEPVEIRLNDEVIEPVDEYLTIKTSLDKMKVTGRFYCASNDGKQLSKEDILSQLESAGITHGVIDENLDRHLQERQYCTDILLARGTPPETSRDAFIEYTFEKEKMIRPTLRSDGTVDYYQLNLINHVKAGDLLATLTPAYEGQAGMDVYGNPKPSRKPMELRLVYGKGVIISEDECQLIAETAGHVTLEKREVTVANIYKIYSDVGTATGNIYYDGCVEVKGDVLSGYVVEATGKIFIGGCVEGATVISGDQIILARGIHGINKGKLVAGGDIIAKFIESCTVTAGGCVSAEAILHSKVTANGEIFVTKNKGLVSGGVLRSSTSIFAKTVGSDRLGTNTLLELGVSPHITERFHELEKKILEKQLERKKLQQLQSLINKKIDSGEQLSEDKVTLGQILPKQITELLAEINRMLNEYAQLKQEIEQADSGKIVIEHSIYPGVKIIISNISYYVHNAIYHCQFIKDGVEIKFFDID